MELRNKFKNKETIYNLSAMELKQILGIIALVFGATILITNPIPFQNLSLLFSSSFASLIGIVLVILGAIGTFYKI